MRRRPVEDGLGGRSAAELLQVGPKHLDDSLQVLLLPTGVRSCGHMLAKMPFYDFRHEPVDRSADSGDLLQNRGTLGFLVQRFLKSRHLSSDTADPRQQRLLVSDRVHRVEISAPYGKLARCSIRLKRCHEGATGRRAVAHRGAAGRVLDGARASRRSRHQRSIISSRFNRAWFDPEGYASAVSPAPEDPDCSA